MHPMIADRGRLSDRFASFVDADVMTSPSMPSIPTLDRVASFIRLGRPRFLMGGFVLYAGGAVLARPRVREIDLAMYVLGQCAITLTQLMTHYANDYFDVEADRHNRAATRWSGGSRVLVNDELAPRVARDAALTLGALALVLDTAIAFASRASPHASVLLLAALFLSWNYSAPPLRLHPRGFGAPTAAIVVGGLTPMIGWAMQHGTVTREIAIAVAPLMMAQLTMILVLDLPDAEGDAAGGKRTLAVRFGTTQTARIAMALVVATYGLVVWMVFQLGMRLVAVAMLATVPTGGLLFIALLKSAWQEGREGGLTSRAVVWFGSLSAALLVGALLA
jgi:1,4-dihydroxy-2-naphthoate polyprenyltransferase